jgi:type II secretory pathway pseudopilin PulG
MRNLLVITTGLIACVLLCGFQQGTAPAASADSKADGRHQNADQGQDRRAALVPSQPVANPSSPNPSKDGNKSQAHEVRVTSLPERIEIKSVKDRIDWTILGCTVVLTIVGLVGTIVALRTLSAIKKQAEIMDEHRVSLAQLAKAAQDNAAAAKASADALINTERAWVIATPDDNSPVIGFIPSAGAGNLEMHLVGANQRNAVSFSLKSTGNTPARLVEIAILYRKANRLDDIPTEPDYDGKIPLNDLPLVTGDSIGFVQFLEPSPILPKSEADAVCRQEAFLYAFGLVVYRDVYDRLHETRFGYVYHFPLGLDPKPKGFRRDGLPPSYNQAT